LALYDEFQDQNATQADTLIKRLGSEGKIVLTGDTEQVHAPYLDSGNNGLVYATQLLYDNPMVAQVYFTEAEVVRHPLVKAVAERQKKGKEPTD
jgi:phosphate starvation-inducible PhoH-like protein